MNEFLGGMMKMYKRVFIALAVAGCLAGCTYTEPVPTESVESAERPPSPGLPQPPAPAPSVVPRTLQGQFQSQAAVTLGTATIRVADSGTVLQLDGFTTKAGDDLRLMLSPGILAPDSTGQPGLSSSTLIELGPLSGSPQQRIDIDARMWSAMPSPVRSVVVYNYADKTTYATANLS